jgi:pyruvate/2-oxoglutarate dehydrogenase complex dihydrolipoamide dehydrogenase (E3) component
VKPRLHTEVKSIGGNCLILSDTSRIRFDAAVVATGCTFRPHSFPGSRKHCVFILNGPEQYSQLGRRMGSLNRVLVFGSGIRALEVADRLSGEGRKVSLFCSVGLAAAQEVRTLLVEAAVDRGVSIVTGRLSAAAGAGAVEAAVVEGDVLPCDAIVVLPGRVPRLPQLAGRRGPRGGLLVNEHLMAASPGVFAAGGCADLRTNGVDYPSVLAGSPTVSGRIAGANAAGLRESISSFGHSASEVFGLRLLASGLRLAEAQAAWPDLATVTHSPGPDSACTIIYERRSGAILGIESVEECGSPYSSSVGRIRPWTTLRALAYGGLADSSDISLVSETARLGLRAWSRFSYATTSKWRD